MRTITTYRPGLNDASTVAIDPRAVNVQSRFPGRARSRWPSVDARIGPAPPPPISEKKSCACDRAPSPIPTASSPPSAMPRFPIAAASPDPTYATTRAPCACALLAAGRVTDERRQLYAAADAVASGPNVPAGAAAARSSGTAGMASAVMKAFLAFRRSLFSEPAPGGSAAVAPDSAWQSQNLDYEFALGSPAPDETITLERARVPGRAPSRLVLVLARPNRPHGNPAFAKHQPITQANSTAKVVDHQAFRLPAQPRDVPGHARSALVELRGSGHRLRPARRRARRSGQAAGDGVRAGLRQRLVLGAGAGDRRPHGRGRRSARDAESDHHAGGHRHLRRPHPHPPSSEQTQVNAGESTWSMFKVSGEGYRAPISS